MSVVSVKPIILNADNGLMYNNTLYAIANDRNANNNKSNHRNSSASSTGLAPGSSANNATNSNMDKSKTSNHQPIIYKFFVPRYVDVVGLRFNIVRACNQCQAIVIHVQANALPTPKNYIHSVVIYANKTSENIVDFYPHQNAWHYIEIGFLNRTKDSDDRSSTTAPPIGLTKAFKSKARLEKKLQFMENNIFVNFSIGLQLINEIQPVVVESSENEPNENKSTAANVNSNKSDSSSSSTNKNGNTGSENVNRSVNTSNSNSSSFLDQNVNQASAASDMVTDADDFDYLSGDENDIESKASASNLSAKPRKINYYTLLRSTYREFFMFDYDLLPDENGTVPTFINLTAGVPTGFRFDVGNVFDVGGTLSFAVVMKDNLHDATLAAAASAANIVKARNRISSDVAVAEKLVHINEELNDAPSHEVAEGKANNAKTIDRMNFELNQSNENDDDDDGPDNSSGSNQTIIICMHMNAAAIPKWPNQW